MKKYYPITMDQRGNALFLILIAVALFAALSYAVTQTSRGGGNINREEAQLNAAKLIGISNSITNHALRYYTIGAVDQMRFDDSAYSAAGTVYTTQTVTSSGTTIGYFTPGEGLPKLYNPVPDPVESNNGRNIFVGYGAYRVNGAELGTSASDEILGFKAITLEACEAINKQLTGSPTIIQFSEFGPVNDVREEHLLFDGTFAGYGAKAIDFDFLPGCHEVDSRPGYYYYVDIIKQQ